MQGREAEEGTEGEETGKWNKKLTLVLEQHGRRRERSLKPGFDCLHFTVTETPFSRSMMAGLDERSTGRATSNQGERRGHQEVMCIIVYGQVFATVGHRWHLVVDSQFPEAVTRLGHARNLPEVDHADARHHS